MDSQEEVGQKNAHSMNEEATKPIEEAVQTNQQEKLIPQLERRINRYEREVTYLSNKNTVINQQLHILLQEKDKFDTSVQDIRNDLENKTKLCSDLQESLSLSERSTLQMKQLHEKTMKESIANLREEEKQKYTTEIERLKILVEGEKEQTSRLQKENENQRECLEILNKQIKEIREAEIVRQNNWIERKKQEEIATSSSQNRHYVAQIEGLNRQIVERSSECSDLSKLLIQQQTQGREQMQKLQEQLQERENGLLLRQMEIEGLKEAIHSYKKEMEYLGEINIEKDSKITYLSKILETERDETQKNIDAKNKELARLLKDLEFSERMLNEQEYTKIPTEEDSIRELAIKNNRVEEELEQEKEKNRKLTAQMEYLKADLKGKLPMLNLRKNEFCNMQQNYTQIKQKLSGAIKTILQLTEDKKQLQSEVNKIKNEKENVQTTSQHIEKDKIIVSYILNLLKKSILNHPQFQTVNLMQFNLEYVKHVLDTQKSSCHNGLTNGELASSINNANQLEGMNYKFEGLQEQLRQLEEKYKENSQIQIEQQSQQQPSTSFNQIDVTELVKTQQETIVELKQELQEQKDKIQKLEQIDLIRHKILGEANGCLSEFKNSQENSKEIEKNQKRLSELVEERDQFRRECSKKQFELSKLQTEFQIIQDMARQEKQQADLYCSKYEQILKSQLQKNASFEQSRTEVKSLKLRLLETTLKAESLAAENSRLEGQLDYLHKQIKLETENYMEATRKKKQYFDRDIKSSKELQELQQKLQEQSSALIDLKEKSFQDLEEIKNSLNEQNVSFQFLQIQQNIKLENYKLLFNHSSSKVQALNKIIIDQAQEIRQLKQVVDNGENAQDLDEVAIAEENFIRLDTQFLKNLNRMEQIVSEQKEEHAQSLKNMQDTLQKLADTCVKLQEKLREAEIEEKQNTQKLANLQNNYLEELDKKEKEYQLQSVEKEKEISILEKRFEDYRLEQANVQQEMTKKFEQEQEVRSLNDESSFKLRKLEDEKEDLQKQLEEIKSYLGEIAAERVIIEAAQQSEMEFYITQLNRANNQQKVKETVQITRMEIEEPTQVETQKQQDKPQTLVQQINEQDALLKFESKVKELHLSEESLRAQNQDLQQIIENLQIELASSKAKCEISENENSSKEDITELKKKQIQEMQEERELHKQERSILLKQIEHLSHLNKSISSEDAANMNELLQKGELLQLLEKLEKYIQLKTQATSLKHK